MASKRKQITFDIDTKVCKQIFGDEKFRQPYKDIGDFLKKYNFKHIEGSSYMSNNGMSNMVLSNIIDDLVAKYPYLTKCVKKMHQTDVCNIHSLESHFEYDGTPGKFAQKEKVEQKQNKGKRQSVAKLLAEKKEIAEKQKKQISKNSKSKSYIQELE